MSRVLLGIAVIAFAIYCVVDCVQSEDDEVRNLPKIVWIIMVLLFPIVGGVAWLLAGRPRQATSPVRGTRPIAPPARSLAPDDDPSFLASLDASADERRRLAEWERELRAREDKISDAGPPRAGGPEQEGPDDSRSTRS